MKRKIKWKRWLIAAAVVAVYSAIELLREKKRGNKAGGGDKASGTEKEDSDV